MNVPYVEGDRVLFQCSSERCLEIYTLELSMSGPETLPPCPACGAPIEDDICEPIEGTFRKLVSL